VTLLNAQYLDSFLTCNGVPCTLPTPALPNGQNLATVPAGNRITGTQRIIGGAEVAWRPGIVPGEFAIEWRAQGSTPVDDLNSDFGAGFGVVGLRWGANLAVTDSGTLQMLARADNIFNRSYVGSVIVNEANKRYFEPGAPRNYLLSLRWLQRF
jgi:iron complex outermembrane receptor protein